jgi:hypothetical protein
MGTQDGKKYGKGGLGYKIYVMVWSWLFEEFKYLLYICG